MLGLAIAVAVIGFVLKAGAALASGWFLVPLAAVAGLCHIVIHAKAAGLPTPPGRLLAMSNILLLGALLMQMEYTPGYNCAEDTLSSVTWRLALPRRSHCPELGRQTDNHLKR